MSEVSGKWRFWIDRGGTFTVVVARAPGGGLLTRKLLSVRSDHGVDAAVQAMRDLMGVGEADAFPADRVAEIRMGTTVATNALLERTGGRVLLLTTRGFRDALAIGYQNRANLFDLNIRKPTPLYERVVEVDERVTAAGEVLRAPDEAAVAAAARERLASYKVPKRVFFVDELPRNTMGKVQKNVLREFYADTFKQ